MRKFFITGTDTDAGKTFCSCVVEKELVKAGFKVRPYKPIVAGFDNGENYDLNSHIRASGCGLKPMDITACPYDEPIAPHIAADNTKNPITYEMLNNGLNKAVSSGADIIVTEGAGGWFLPIGNGHVLPDWPEMHTMSVIIVVGLKLGCLNHALLTAEAIRIGGFRTEGFITKTLTPESMPYETENIKTLEEMMKCPHIGHIPYIKSGDFMDPAASLDVSVLTEGLVSVRSNNN